MKSKSQHSKKKTRNKIEDKKIKVLTPLNRSWQQLPVRLLISSFPLVPKAASISWHSIEVEESCQFGESNVAKAGTSCSTNVLSWERDDSIEVACNDQ